MVQWATFLLILSLGLSPISLQGAERFNGSLSVLPNYCLTYGDYKKKSPKVAKLLATTFRTLKDDAPIVCVLFKKTDSTQEDQYGQIYIAERLPALAPMVQCILKGGKVSDAKISLLDCSQDGHILMTLPLLNKNIDAKLESLTVGRTFSMELQQALLLIKDKLPQIIKKQIKPTIERGHDYCKFLPRHR